MKKFELVEAILNIAETGAIDSATNTMARAIEGCAGLHATFLTAQGAHKQVSYALTATEVGERLKHDFQTPEDNPFVAAMQRLPMGRLTPVERYLDMDAYVNSQLYQELIEPYDVPHISTIVLPGRHGLMSFGLGQKDGATQLNYRAAERMAFQVSRAMDMYTGSLSPDRKAFLVDASGCLTGYGDISVRRLTQGALQQSSRGGAIEPTLAALKQAFAERIRHVALTGEDQQLICPNSEGNLVSISLSSGPSIAIDRTIWVNVEQGQRLHWTSDDICAVYSLTKRESSIALAIINGHNAQTASVALGLSERSVRTYLSNIFGKLGISSQADLVRNLLGHGV